MQNKSKSSAFSTLMNYAGKYRMLTYLSLTLAVITAFLAIMPFVFLWRIIREVIEVNPDFEKATGITTNGWLAVLFSLLSMLIYFAALMCSHLSAFRVAANLKKTLLSRIAELPVGFADDLGSGKIRRTVMDVTSAAESLLAHNLPDMAQAVAMPIFMIMMLFLYDWRFGIVCLLPVAIGFVFMSKMAGPGMQDDVRQYQNALERMTNEAVEYIRGMPVVKTFGQTVFSFHRFKKAIDDYGEFCMHYTRTSRFPMVMFTLSINAAFAFLIALVLFLVKGSSATQELLINFLFYVIFTPMIVTTMNRVLFMSENGMQMNDAIERVNALLEEKSLSEPTVGKRPKGASVSLNHVTFRYEKDAKPAVLDVSITAKEGRITALVGPSGSGKTTVASLIARFFDAEEGSVEIGGVNVKEISQSDRMNTVSYVFWDSRLLKRSIADNLLIAKPDATEEELLAVLYAAQCQDILDRLPEGMNTVLGSEGTYLSGGERQRVAIARALLKKAPIVILDEATAFADPENEVLVQRAFMELAKDTTVIMIAHRLSTIRNADRIYVLENGQVVEDGRHDDLLANNGLYRQMWNEYQKAVQWKVGGR